MVLRNGISVQQYIYGDTDHVAQRVATHRVRQLQSMYHIQLPESALQGFMSTLPMDITQVTEQQLHQAVRHAPVKQWLVVAGWPCQDFSSAGPSHGGLKGSRAQLLHHLVAAIGTLQQLSQQLPPAYIFENVPFQFHRNKNISQVDFQQVCNIIGTPVMIDAAQFGSLAHRARNYWTNLAHPELMAATLEHVKRPANRTVQMILPEVRQAQPVFRQDTHPHYQCNHTGQARAAWPTIMAKPGSYAFRPGQPGSVLDLSNANTPIWTEQQQQKEKLL
jgi:site-specific DNA-cytosine methylase